VPASGRWAVTLDPPHAKALKVKPENMKLVYDPAMSINPISLHTLLMQLEPKDHFCVPAMGKQMTDKRIAQRKALVAVLRLAAGHNKTDPQLNDPTCQILELCALDPLSVQPRQLYSWALVCRAWAAAVKAWLASASAHAFWQRVCIGMLPAEVVLHPELCTKDMLREWAALPMAVGTKQQWYRCGVGMARDEEESKAMTELELAIRLAQLFKLWWNVGDSTEDSPRFVGWMRLYFEPFLDGRTHETEAHPGEWELNSGDMPQSLLANVCDCIQDFRHCPMVQIPELMDDDLRRTLCAVVAKFECQTPRGTQWRCMTAPQITPEKNAAFYTLLKRYCPLFPQRADKVQRVVGEPVFKRGRRHAYELPRREKWRLWPHMANSFLILDRMNSTVEYESWTFDEDVTNRDERGVLEGEQEAYEEGEEGDEMEDDDEDDDAMESDGDEAADVI